MDPRIEQYLQQSREAERQGDIAGALWANCALASAPAQLHQATSAIRRLLEPELPEKFPSHFLLSVLHDPNSGDSSRFNTTAEPDASL
jgi:DNA-binding SARP family transcriptional activator